MTTLTAGCLPGAVGRAKKAGISPSAALTLTMFEVVSIALASLSATRITDAAARLQVMGYG
jgi:hypothetical protein